jgi:hypothetical protein
MCNFAQNDKWYSALLRVSLSVAEARSALLHYALR